MLSFNVTSYILFFIYELLFFINPTVCFLHAAASSVLMTSLQGDIKDAHRETGCCLCDYLYSMCVICFQSFPSFLLHRLFL